MDQTGWLEIPAASDGSNSAEVTLYNNYGHNYSLHYDYDAYASLWVAYPLSPSKHTRVARRIPHSGITTRDLQ